MIPPKKPIRFSRPAALHTARTAVLCGLTILPSFLVAAPPRYLVKDLGALPTSGSPGSYGFGVNASGQVSGFSKATAPGGSPVDHAFIHNGATLIDLGSLPGGGPSYGMDINAAGWVTGRSYVLVGSFSTHAFVHDGTAMIDLGTLGEVTGGAPTSSEGYGINAAGQVTGFSFNAAGAPRAFLHDGTTMSELGTLGGSASIGFGINDAGQVVGVSSIAGNSAAHAFVTSGVTPTDLGTLGGPNSAAYGINAAGQVTGYADTAAGLPHAFLATGPGTMLDLGTLGGTQSFGAGVNAAGQVAGYSYTTGDAALHGFIYTGGTMHDLNDLVLPGSYIRDISLNAEGNPINDAGQIAGYGLSDVSGEYHAVLLTPLTPLETWRYTHYSTVVNTGAAADLADPNGTGVPNLAAYAFGLNPKDACMGGLPQPQLVGGNVVLSFTPPPYAGGVIYGAEWSTTLEPGSWTALPDTGLPPQHTFAVPPGTYPRLFLRTVITKP